MALPIHPRSVRTGAPRDVLFSSLARDLAAGSFSSGYENLFVRDLQNATNYALTHWVSFSGRLPFGALMPDWALRCLLWWR